MLIPSAETCEDSGGVLRQLQSLHGHQLRQGEGGTFIIEARGFLVGLQLTADGHEARFDIDN